MATATRKSSLFRSNSNCRALPEEPPVDFLRLVLFLGTNRCEFSLIKSLVKSGMRSRSASELICSSIFFQIPFGNMGLNCRNILIVPLAFSIAEIQVHLMIKSGFLCIV